MQIDWKESFKYTTSDGETVYLNVFVAILGYSRYLSYGVNLDRKQNTLFANLDRVFEEMGGVPKEILTDNMTTIMDEARTPHSEGKVNERFQEFADDYGFKIVPCTAKRPSTKGKVEPQMKLLDEIDAYQGMLTYEELVEKVRKMALKKNLSLHPSTGWAPHVLWEKEKDSLLPLPSQEIRSRFYYHSTVKVNKSSMISYKSNQYSVPTEYTGKIQGIEVLDNTIYLYDNTSLVTKHKISSNKLNYHLSDYQEIVEKTMPYRSWEDVEKISKMNLEKLDEIYGR